MNDEKSHFSKSPLIFAKKDLKHSYSIKLATIRYRSYEIKP